MTDNVNTDYTESAPPFQQKGGQQPANFYSFGPEQEQTIRNIRTTTLEFPVHFCNMERNSDLEATLRHVFEKAIDRGFSLTGPGGKVGIKITHPGQDPNMVSPYAPFSTREQLTIDKIMNKFVAVLQSNEEFKMDDELRVYISAYRP
jgi:hypothetical protein